MTFYLSGENSVPEEQTPITIGCSRPVSFLLHLGPFRDFSYNRLALHEQETCHAKDVIFSIAFAINVVSTTFQILSIVVMIRGSLWKQRKYLQYILINFTTTVSALCFTFFLFYRFVIENELMACVLGFNVFIFGIGWNFFAMMSLVIDCFVAVFWPLQFRVVMTIQQFLIFNSSVFAFLVVTVLVPIPYFGSFNDGYIQYFCAFEFIFPLYYRLFTYGLFAFFSILFIVFNVSVALGVAVAFAKRRSLTNNNNNNEQSSKNLLKTILRLMLLIATNVLLSLPLVSQPITYEYFPLSLGFLFSSSTGSVNTLILVMSDGQFRLKISEAFSRERKPKITPDSGR